MAPRKLSESDKQEILSAYRQSDETTSTLANQYSVSVSTISRILKQSLPEREYDTLVQQKRSGATRSPIEPQQPEIEPEQLEALPEAEAFAMEEPVLLQVPDSKPKPPQLRLNKRSQKEDSEESFASTAQLELDPLLTPSSPSEEAPRKPQIVGQPRPGKTILKSPEAVKSTTLLTNQIEGLDLLDEEPLEDDLDDDLDDDDLDLDDDDLDDDTDLSDEGDLTGIQVRSDRKIQVLPLSEATIPRTCYVVVDRASELITRPLKDFAELGQIPTEEIQEKTLPIFDNHRIAKRFLRRMQRVVKVPDGQILKKVRPYLQAKGITRLLIDGQIYSL
ncbi:MAG: transposase [Oscillatoriophycideae cyanobacterium NC_groundwater_1537_Pr4_S-0.65um_50_18]|nr:transposase [Oscillatoriophycideae cyanobacterium NC_groundwater_1537_Pr4_S-0.65um_50_18]